MKAHKEISFRTLGIGFAVQNFISERYLPSLSLTDLGSSDLFQEIQPSLKECKYDTTKIFKIVPSSLCPKGKATSKEGGSDSLGPGFGGPFFREPPRGNLLIAHTCSLLHTCVPPANPRPPYLEQGGF